MFGQWCWDLDWDNVQLCQFAEFSDGVECGTSKPQCKRLTVANAGT